SFDDSYQNYFHPNERKELKFISLFKEQELGIDVIDSSLLLEHIPDLRFRIDYMDRVSAIPTNSLMA
ncbi:MAG: hypothetical protein HON90_02455, partial [Halobacteriovoraceae bacterium]|nr:hypothetical protein [Halobacteriovoraceae bacterium]